METPTSPTSQQPEQAPPAAPEPAPIATPTPGKASFTKWVIIGGIAVVTLAASGLVAYKMLQKPTEQPVAQSTSSEQSEVATVCLTQDDYKYMNSDKQPDSVPDDTTYGATTDNKVAGMYFEPDSTVENSIVGIYDDWAEFASKNAAKQWKFLIEGSIHGTNSTTNSDAGVALANARSQRVKDQLVQRGVPEERIVVMPPHDYSKEAQDSQVSQIYRRVQIIVDPTCTEAQ